MSKHKEMAGRTVEVSHGYGDSRVALEVYSANGNKIPTLNFNRLEANFLGECVERTHYLNSDAKQRNEMDAPRGGPPLPALVPSNGIILPAKKSA